MYQRLFINCRLCIDSFISLSHLPPAMLYYMHKKPLLFMFKVKKSHRIQGAEITTRQFLRERKESNLLKLSIAFVCKLYIDIFTFIYNCFNMCYYKQ